MLKIQTFEVNPLQENCYVVSDETKECVIIDCGALTESEQDAIIAYIKKEGLTPVHNLGTHGHLDHHFGDAIILATYNLQPEVSEGDAVFMNNPKQAAAQMLGMELGHDLPAGELNLTEGQLIEFGSHTFKVMHTPGHSGGSVCFYCAEENILFPFIYEIMEASQEHRTQQGFHCGSVQNPIAVMMSDHEGETARHEHIAYLTHQYI